MTASRYKYCLYNFVVSKVCIYINKLHFLTWISDFQLLKMTFGFAKKTLKKKKPARLYWQYKLTSCKCVQPEGDRMSVETCSWLM